MRELSAIELRGAGLVARFGRTEICAHSRQCDRRRFRRRSAHARTPPSYGIKVHLVWQ